MIKLQPRCLRPLLIISVLAIATTVVTAATLTGKVVTIAAIVCGARTVNVHAVGYRLTRDVPANRASQKINTGGETGHRI